MFAHNKRLQYTVRVAECNPALANLMLEQFGGPQGELAAAMRYFTQALAEDDPGRKDMLLDIATEELSHLEVIGTIVGMLNKGAKGKLAEGAEEQAQAFRQLQGAGNDSHVTQVLYGGGPTLTNSGGQLWSAGYIDSIGEPTADLRSNIAAEARAKIIYERLINLTADAGVREALGFLMTREISHQQSFEKALYAIQPNFPPGQAAGQAGVRQRLRQHLAGRGRHARAVEQRRELPVRVRSRADAGDGRRQRHAGGVDGRARALRADADGPAHALQPVDQPGDRRRAGARQQAAAGHPPLDPT